MSKSGRDANRSNHHIRFDQDGVGGDAVSDDIPSLISNNNSPPPLHSPPAVSATSKNPRAKNKRKRKCPSTTTTPKKEAGDKIIFNGLIVAISTFESTHKNGAHDDVDPYQNFKTLKNILQSMGATISPQVHKRVHYLISTDSALTQLTQRVRQALRRDVNIVDVAWIKKCKDGKTRVDADKYLCNDSAKCLMMEKKKRDELANEVKGAKENKLEGEECSDGLGEDNAGWSTPIELDCCCVCHENGDDDCPWCKNCNLTLARKKLL